MAKPPGPGFYLTGSGEAFRRTVGGTKKLTGSELFLALAAPLQERMPKLAAKSELLVMLPRLHARAQLNASLVRGRRVLWVDDMPANTHYERVALAEMGLVVDVATSSEEALHCARHLNPDVIISDMERHGYSTAGIKFLEKARTEGIVAPLIFYIGLVDHNRGTPAHAFGITDRPDEVLHLVLDVLSR